MEPTLVRRISVGVLVACLIVMAGAMGWARAGAARRAREVDLPAAGGMLVEEGRDGAASSSGGAAPGLLSQSQRAPAAALPQAAEGARKAAVTASPSRGGGRADAVHEVQKGETLFRIAKRHGVAVAELQRANGLASDLIRPGQLLVVPGGSLAGGGLSLGGTYIWPVLAPVSSTFGPRWGRNHNGIDLAANQGDEIRASRAGVVLIAETVTGYGETVILQHDDGTRTVYAHCSKLLVTSGQQVKQGQVIALVGSTGNSTGPHLHFEIIVNDRPTDPLLHLPKR